MTKNNFPPHYANNISETCLPFELMPEKTTLEYVIPNQQAQNPTDTKPVFILVVDTVVSSEDMVELKDSL
jgi:protein transport protein SEC23